MHPEHLQKLRNKQPLRLWDKANKMFVHIQLNKKEGRICWERWVSKDKKNWVNWNLYLSLKDVSNITKQIKGANQAAINLH